MLRRLQQFMILSNKSVNLQYSCEVILRNRNYCAQNAKKFEDPQQQQQQQQQQRRSEQEEEEDQEEKQKNKQRPQFLPSIKNPFESISEKNKNTYLTMVEIFIERDKHRRNHVEFIYAAMKNMEQFGVETDLEVYKALIEVMPKGKFIPQNIFQAEFMHYPKQQQCIIDLLEQMEDYGVMPDPEMEQMLLNVFGRRGHPLRKYWRMMYWMPKFRNLSPWRLPEVMPDDVLELAKLAVERMCSVDLLPKVSVYETKDVPEALDKTWIVSGMSDEQKKLLLKHPKNTALYIEGPFIIWLRHRTINYFTLRAEPNKEYLQRLTDQYLEYDNDDVTKIKVPKFGEPLKAAYPVADVRSVHEQDDGTILAICATGTSSKDSLLSWIRLLEEDGNPSLGQIPILFRFKSKITDRAVQIEEGTKSVENEKKLS